KQREHDDGEEDEERVQDVGDAEDAGDRAETTRGVRHDRGPWPRAALVAVRGHRGPRERGDVPHVARGVTEGPEGQREGEESEEDRKGEGKPRRTETPRAVDPGPQFRNRVHRPRKM